FRGRLPRASSCSSLTFLIRSIIMNGCATLGRINPMRTLLALLMLAALPLAAQESEQTTEPTEQDQATENPTVILHTNLGPITVELFEQEAPKSTANFLQYARDGHYDGTIFHRVIDNFMIQGGGFDTEFKQKPTREPIENEAD